MKMMAIPLIFVAFVLQLALLLATYILSTRMAATVANEGDAPKGDSWAIASACGSNKHTIKYRFASNRGKDDGVAYYRVLYSEEFVFLYMEQFVSEPERRKYTEIRGVWNPEENAYEYSVPVTTSQKDSVLVINDSRSTMRI